MYELFKSDERKLLFLFINRSKNYCPSTIGMKKLCGVGEIYL